MQKQEIFSKFKDYNNELEKVLETKKFSEAAKNLLLSMLYKIEASYKDYAKVKVEGRTKEEFIEEIIENIRENCNEIEIVKASTEIEKIDVLKEEKKIISQANEREMLKAIIQISNGNYKIEEEDFYLEEPIKDLLTFGKTMNNTEIIRDFDGWSWNIQKSQIDNFEYNLLYQNLRFLIGSKEINNILNWKECMLKIKKNMKENTKNQTEKIVKQIILGMYIRSSLENKNYIENRKEEIKKEIEKMGNKILLIEKVSQEKKEYAKKIKIIDKTINNRRLLIEEYKNRNLKAKPEERIFSVSDLVEILETERKNILEKIYELNKRIEPEKYIRKKEILENAEHELVEALEKQDEEWQKLKIEYQRKFLEYLIAKLQKTNTKKDILKFIYTFRYYLSIPISQEESVKDIKELEKEFENIFYIVIKKACNLKLIETVHEDPKINSEILKSIFYVKVIDLEDIEIEIEKKAKNLKIIICEQESIDNTREIVLEQENNLKLKYNKKIKIFS